ncbi:winged helix-turn-helix transcriptional regulator [Streptomyces muensis]|uniref:Helix-turn-helix transcriptional regulator n=1 Tax=Streptomyces muensis TaxID=1077944 RepID=A0A9X1Q0L4_STRM4|nr:helix-turn-helix domain-containing protein [Streptomyces muensis]MCF1596940.1 helix-turn-helix transcriptional regulator [Streptomyces muensis]
MGSDSQPPEQQPPPPTEPPELACPVSPVVDLVFSRWTTPILWTLNEFGRQRFVELQRAIGTITPKVLTQRLRQMERDGLVVRTYHPEVPPRVEYEISELGRSLAPVFAHLADWSAQNLPKVERARREFDAAGEQR